MPEAGDYILTSVGFSSEEKPSITLQDSHSFYHLEPYNKTLTLQFNISKRYCIGWRDITKGERFVCPEHHVVESKYEECAACQKRTGFNPAFYHANTVSKQQEARNLEPHALYLAHFAPGLIKVGISHHARKHSRLLEQGARSALLLDIFPTAHIARQYEARIATLPGIAETIQLSKKLAHISNEYDSVAARQELTDRRVQIEHALATSFASQEVHTFDTTYFPTHVPRFQDAYDLTSHHVISGKSIGMLGSILYCEQQDRSVFLPLKKYIGYIVHMSYTTKHINLPPRQSILF